MRQHWRAAREDRALASPVRAFARKTDVYVGVAPRVRRRIPPPSPSSCSQPRLGEPPATRRGGVAPRSTPDEACGRVLLGTAWKARESLPRAPRAS